MKKTTPVLMLLCSLLFALALPLQANPSKIYSIKKVEAELIGSPEIPGGPSKRSAGKAGQWLEIDVTFDRHDTATNAPKFSGDLTFNYYILLDNKSSSKDGKPTLLTGTITQTEAPLLRGLHVAAFVTPQTIAFFFEGKPPTTIQQAIIDIGVTISDDTGVADQYTMKGKPGWWDNPAQIESVSTVAGRVLSKDSTPFSALSWDYYLPPKAKSGN
jgi:hypothetical protein